MQRCYTIVWTRCRINEVQPQGLAFKTQLLLAFAIVICDPFSRVQISCMSGLSLFVSWVAQQKWGVCFAIRQLLKNYFTSSEPHHDMLGGGCQVRVVIKNMMGRMENLRTLISGFLGLVILVRWALVSMFLSWTTQTGCRIHRTYVSLIGSGEGRHTTHLLIFVLLLSTSQTDWKQSSDVLSDISFDILSDKSSDISSDILSDISSDILSDIFLTYLLTFFLTNLLTFFPTYLLTFFLTYLSTCFLTYLLTFFLTYQNQNLTSTASQKKPLCKLYI